jgi:hypothetical protein
MAATRPPAISSVTNPGACSPGVAALALEWRLIHEYVVPKAAIMGCPET